MLNPFTNRKVIRHGEPARAWIRRMPSPPRGTSPQSISMTLDVERADGARYEVQDRWMVAGDEPISVGSELRILVDRESRSRIAIDWDTTREVYREKTEERRQLLTVGVPVPASKLRQEAEDRGLVEPAAPEPPPAVEPTPAAEAIGGYTPAPSAAQPLVHADEAPGVPEPNADGDAGGELLERLERVATLHAAGSLTDDEFAAVKRHLLA